MPLFVFCQTKHLIVKVLIAVTCEFKKKQIKSRKTSQKWQIVQEIGA